jgi:hypothetical protein
MGAIRLAPVHERLLRATLAHGDAARAAYEAWARLVPFDAIDAEGYRLVPGLSRALDAAGVVDAVTPRLQGIRRRTWYANQLALPVIDASLAALGRAGIQHRVLGGALSILHGRNDRGAYPLDALDLLLPPARHDAALAALIALGWKRARRSDGVHLLTHEKVGHLAVHGRITHGVLPDNGSASEDVVWSRPRPVAVLARRAFLINAEVQLLFVAEYRLAGGHHPLRALTEAAVLMTTDTPIAWDTLLEQSRRCQAGAALAALFESLGCFLPDPAPAGFVDELLAAAVAVPAARGTEASVGARSMVGRLRQSCGSLWRSYGRAAHQQSRRRTLRGFAGFLTGHWQLSSPWRLPVAIGRRGLRLVIESARLP